MGMRRLLLLPCLLLAACGGGGDGGQAGSGDGQRPETSTSPRTTSSTPARAPGRKTIATGLEVPWGVAFLPGGDALVAERTTGRVLRVPEDGGAEREVMRLPGVDGDSGGEGGLLGLAISPRYAQDERVFAYYTTEEDNRIVSFSLGGRVEPVLTGLKNGVIHNGGKIAFGPDGKLYAGVGEVGDDELAQDRSAREGKILRLNPDGSVPRDNPFPGSPVWSLGHRNVQGFDWDSAGRMWASEFGQDELDEVNLIEKGRNYGWPEREGKGSTDGGKYTNPKETWSTSEASPSGAAILGSTLYLGALRGEAVLRVRLSGRGTDKLSPLLEGKLGRVRGVAEAPDGSLWVWTSNRDGRGSPRKGDDRIVRVPAGAS